MKQKVGKITQLIKADPNVSHCFKEGLSGEVNHYPILISAVKQLLDLLSRNPERLTRAERETIEKIKECL
jgi:hypothetical protein